MSEEREYELCHVLTVIDGETEEMVDVAEIKKFEIGRFRRQFGVSEVSDPEMLERYGVGPDDTEFICESLGFVVTFDFQRYAYFVEAAKKHK